jgi:hypothetical protein
VGGVLGQEGGLLVGFHSLFFLRFKILGVFLVVQGVFGGGGFNVVRAVEEFGAESEGEGV